MSLRRDSLFISQLLGWCFIFLFVGFVFASYKIRHFPDPNWILPELYRYPKQTDIFPTEMNLVWRGRHYRLKLVASYELWGMVVSLHNSKQWRDFYHRFWRDYLNFADVCVIWGDNLKDPIYANIKKKKIKFSNSATVCYFQWQDCIDCFHFKIDSFSNNHLLSSDDTIRAQILNLKPGDQIYIKGYLCDYEMDNGRYVRHTSISRTDIGDGACEVIYVTEFRLLRQANASWRQIYKFCGQASFIAFTLWALWLFV